MRQPCDRGGVRWYLLVLSLLAAKATLWSILIGSAPFVAGILMHLWAKGCLHQNRQVTMSGPYRFVRHPFYLGNLLMDGAIVVMSGSTILMAAFPLWWVAVYLPVMRREETVMTQLFGREYTEYRRKVPMFLPVRRPLPASNGFSWRNENLLRTEVPRALRFLSYPLFFVIALELREKMPPSHPHTVWTPALPVSLVLILAFNALAWRTRVVSRGGLPLRQWYSKRPMFLAVIALFVLAGSFVDAMEVGKDALVWPAGAMLIGVSVFVRFHRPEEGLSALLLLAAGASFLWEVPWLSLPFVFAGLPVWLYARLAPDPDRLPERPMPLGTLPLSRAGFFIVAFICLLSAVAKEFV